MTATEATPWGQSGREHVDCLSSAKRGLATVVPDRFDYPQFRAEAACLKTSAYAAIPYYTGRPYLRYAMQPMQVDIMSDRH